MRTLILMLCLATAPAFGQILVVGTNPDSYHVLHRDQSGNVTLTKIERVVSLDGTGPIDPGTPPTDKFGLAEFVKEAASKIDDADTKSAIGQVYRLLAQAIKDGSITDPQDAATAAKTAVDLFLARSSASDKAKWKVFQTALKTRLDALAASGKIKTIADVQQAYEEIGAGLTGEEAISPAMLALIIQIIKIVLELIAAGK